MSEELNLQSPYNYSAGDLNTYRFETVSGVEYIAYFIEIPGFQSSRVYSFSFERISERRGHDLRVAITISKIIIDFFTRNDDALIFTCDNHDRKHQYRNILFERWFNRYAQGDFIKYNKYAGDIYASIISYKYNPLNREILAEFDEYFDELNDL